MNNLFDTIYSDMFVMIVASAFIAVMITSLTSILVKVNLSGYAIPLTSLFGFFFIRSNSSSGPTSFKERSSFFKNNNVPTNAMINTIILSCSDALSAVCTGLCTTIKI
ncbi:hypothetical protein [Acinetobacter baumannii]|uniref:hypothetical protein n=1 Tax=Acinetobacter baumannii TaxID=470 RepID=UPI001D17EDAE|nr:hypothetical protein [Acinetobacter baumannii]